MRKKTPPNKPYKLSLSVNGQSLNSEGKTLLEAVQGLKTGVCKTKGVIVVDFEGKKTERMLNIRQMRQLFQESEGFGAEVARIRQVKFLELLIK